jgi:hypothetical protein
MRRARPTRPPPFLNQILNACADMGAKRVAGLEAVGAHLLSATRVALPTARTLADINTVCGSRRLGVRGRGAWGAGRLLPHI